MNPKETKEPKKSRKYPEKDVKILFAMSAGYCAFPRCSQRCVVEKTVSDPHVVIGHIAHIVAHSKDGPRGQSSLSDDERDCYQNWILLCPTHHTVIDKQPNHYTIEDLKEWKKRKEDSITQNLEEAVVNITFVELEAVTSGILQNASKPSTNFDIIEIPDKLQKNNLSFAIREYLAIGSVRYTQVEEYIQTVARVDLSFPERLKAGFTQEYNKLRLAGHEGDELFLSLCDFAYQNKDNILEKAACLSVLSYLFITCEVFEK
jgi:hypothetical protein